MKKENVFDDFEVIDMASEMGDVVCCDFCNLGEDTMGGVMIGSNAVCGACCCENGYYLNNVDDVDYFFDRNKTFKENVLKYRKDNARNKINSTLKFRIGEGHTFKDSISNLNNMQLDIENILRTSVESEADPSDYLDAVTDYIRRRPSMFEVLKSAYKEFNLKDIDEFARTVAMLHLQVKQEQIKKKVNEKEESIKIEAPQITGYKISDSITEQKRLLDEVRNNDDMKDIFPDIARA